LCQPEFSPGTTIPPNPFVTRDLFPTSAGTGTPLSFGLTVNAVSDSDARVPEPTTLFLLGSGFAGLGVLRHRKRRAR
jgi:hypothetical protein